MIKTADAGAFFEGAPGAAVSIASGRAVAIAIGSC
jgi:hypothetical protein